LRHCPRIIFVEETVSSADPLCLATRGHVWDSFSSETYKTRPAPGPIQVWNPYTEADETFSFPADGRGYYRTPSLISIWATAPFLHNNSVGQFNGDPSVKGRIEAFNDAIEKLLWPEKRLGTTVDLANQRHI
jgi:hypothetical protein